MLSFLLHRAAPRAHARLFGLAACIWGMWMPVVQAAEAIPPEHSFSAPFNHYQGWRDEPLQDWRQVNDRVGEIGGWRTYLREAQPAEDGSGQTDHGHHGH